jgi:protein TonB
MARLEKSTVPARSMTDDSAADLSATREPDVVADVPPAERGLMMPLTALLVAMVFAASAWFFYHQGQRDAMLGAASPATSDDTTARGPTELAANGNGDPATAATVVQTSSYGEPDMIVTVHPTAAQMQSPTKPVRKTMLAKASKPAKAAPLISATAIDREVALTTRPQPVYPAQALRAREQGTVLVLAQVDVNGHVSDARIVRRSGSSVLDRAAPNEVRRWKFSPALHDGEPIVASVEVPVSYRLDQ